MVVAYLKAWVAARGTVFVVAVGAAGAWWQSIGSVAEDSLGRDAVIAYLRAWVAA